MSAATDKKTFLGAISRFGRDERAATSIEYAMIACGISIAIASMVYAVGNSLKVNFYQKVDDAAKN